MNKKEIIQFNLVYDSVYDLESIVGSHIFRDFMTKLKEIVKKQGYKFELVERSQKFKLMRLEK